jgi:hypothetical protein
VAKTYKWNTTVCAVTNLGLVDIDEYSGMTQWAIPAITLNNSFRLPSNGLFVNQLNGCIWLRLYVGFSVSQTVWFLRGNRKKKTIVFAPRVSPLKHLKTGTTDLMLHDRLFKARTRHGPLSGLLAGGPGGGTVRSLKQAVTLARLW